MRVLYSLVTSTTSTSTTEYCLPVSTSAVTLATVTCLLSSIFHFMSLIHASFELLYRLHSLIVVLLRHDLIAQATPAGRHLYYTKSKVNNLPYFHATLELAKDII